MRKSLKGIFLFLENREQQTERTSNCSTTHNRGHHPQGGIMKITTLVVMMLIGIITSSTANAAEVQVEKDASVSVGTNPDGSLKITTKPTVAPAKAEAKQAPAKKKKGAAVGKKKSKKAEVATPVAPTALSPTAVNITVYDMTLGSSFTAKAVGANGLNGTIEPIMMKKVWNTRTKKYDEVPVKAGEKSPEKNGSNANFKFNGFNIFMPDKLTSTPRADHLSIAYGVRMFSSTNSANQPAGFQTQSSDMNTVTGDLALKAKVWRLGLEYRPLEQRSTLDTKFYGASLGALDVITSNVILVKFYAIDEQKWSAFIGLGTENTRIEGSIRMGGFKFKTDGEGQTPVMQLGTGYRFNRYLSVEALYEKSNVVVTTKIPGAPDLRTTRDDRVMARIDLGLF